MPFGRVSLVATISGDRGPWLDHAFEAHTLAIIQAIPLDQQPHALFPDNDPGQLPVAPAHEPDGVWSWGGKAV